MSEVVNTEELVDLPVVQEPVYVEPLLTVAALGTTKGTVKTVIAEVNQYVEPERDGEVWCTQEDAEHYAVKALLPYFVGMNKTSITKHSVSFAGNILTVRIGS